MRRRGQGALVLRRDVGEEGGSKGRLTEGDFIFKKGVGWVCCGLGLRDWIGVGLACGKIIRVRFGIITHKDQNCNSTKL